MAQQSSLPIVYDSFYAAGQETETTRRKKAQVATFWEKVKDADSKLYQKHVKEEATLERGRIRSKLVQDTPEMQAKVREAREWAEQRQLKKLSSELVMLGLDAITTKSDVRNAYRRKARKLHPDVGGDEEAFKQLHTAYRTLLKEAKA